MSKIPEGGEVGTAHTKSYTFTLQMIAYALLGFFVFWDVLNNDANYLSLASGLESKLFIVAWFLCIAGVVPFVPFWGPGPLAGIISMLYTQYSGTVYVQDRLGYAKSGAHDIVFWSYYFPLVVTLFLFIKIIPAGTLGVFRVFFLAIVPPIAGRLLVRVLARFVFSQLYGPPQYTWLVHPTSEEERQRHDQRWREIMHEETRKKAK